MSSGKNPPVIHTDGLTKHYGRLVAVDHINLEVFRGDLFGFLGPNGAGKTTTIRMLAGLILPTAGDAWIASYNIRTHLPEILCQVGVVMDTPAFYPHLSGRDNLEVIVRLLKDKPARSVDEVLDRVGLSANAHRPFHTYSLGLKKRLDIAAILLREPDILILDEPTSGLDPRGAHQIRQLLLDLVHEGKTVFFSSHLLGDVEKLCNRVAIIKDGRVVAQDTLSNLLGRGHGIVQMRIEQATEAVKVFAAMPQSPLLRTEGNIFFVATSKVSLEDVLCYLAQHNLHPSEISAGHNLEQIFLDLTEGHNE